jgi:superfamily II DNA or RNA helicase
VVIDEAHHAVAPTYRDLLDFLQQEADPVLVGLTATPWPSGFEAGTRLRNRFPQVVATAAVVDLVRSGVLARPIHHTVDTGERIELTREELAALGGADLPANVLRRLDADPAMKSSSTCGSHGRPSGGNDSTS